MRKISPRSFLTAITKKNLQEKFAKTDKKTFLQSGRNGLIYFVYITEFTLCCGKMSKADKILWHIWPEPIHM